MYFMFVMHQDTKVNSLLVKTYFAINLIMIHINILNWGSDSHGPKSYDTISFPAKAAVAIVILTTVMQLLYLWWQSSQSNGLQGCTCMHVSYNGMHTLWYRITVNLQYACGVIFIHTIWWQNGIILMAESSPLTLRLLCNIGYKPPPHSTQ